MKRTLTLIFTLLAFASVTAQNRPTVAVVLSGGGAKGVAHIGALKVIAEAGIPVDIVCGTSMGALVGGLYSIGYTPDELDSIVRAQDWTTLLSDRIDPDLLNLHQREEQNTYALIRGITNDRPQLGGLIRGRNLMQLFSKLCAGYLDSISFDNLPIRYACVATDLVTGGEVDFRSGQMVRAMRASMAIPGVFTPVRMGDMVLVDGGLTNNYPADLARDMGADIIIGVNVQNAPRTADEIAAAGSVMNQIIDLNSRNKYEENAAMSDVFIKVDVTGYSAASFSRSAIDTLLRRGEEEARRHLDELVAIAERIGDYKTADTTNHGRERAGVAANSPILTPHASSLPTIGIPIARVGFRFDSEEMGALQLGGTLPVHSYIPLQLDAVLRLGRRLEAKAAVTLFPRGFTSPTLSYTFRRNDLDIYSKGFRAYNVLYHQHQADLLPFNFNWRRYNVRAGLRWDWFDYYGRILTSFSGVPSEIAALTDDHWFSYHIVADQNNENHWYFPTSGQRTHIRTAYITDNLLGIDGHEGVLDMSGNWRINFRVSKHLTLQPMLYGRVLLGSDVPLCYTGALGTEWFGQYVEQQMPFDGIKYTEYIERNIVALRLQAQYRLKNHYIHLRFTAATCHDELADLIDIPNLRGTSLAYFYDTYFGPVGATLGFNNMHRKPVFYITLGHRF